MTNRSPFVLPDKEKIVGRWPEGALVYHIYPRSFQDSNGDGIGDLPGVTQRFDYLESLGVTAIWLSPFYPSPMADFGYDVADYCNVDPIFGTLDDFKNLLAEAGKRNIKVMIDLVPNHTSDDHAWFSESRKSKAATNPFRDWYIWRDGITVPDTAAKPSGPAKAKSNSRPLPPNNWRDALTGGPAWQWDSTRQQYYLHSFDVRQPDLNWGNPAVREAIRAAMRFWLDLGVDGFRVDAVYWMAKEPLLSDDPVNPEYVEGEDDPYSALKHDNSRGWPAVYAYLSEMADVLHEPSYSDKQRFMVTEAYPEGHNPLVEYLNFYVGMDPLVAAPFNFEGLSLPWNAPAWRKFLRAFHSALGQIDPHCVPSYAFGNHDQPRIASRLGEPAARSAAVLLLTLPGMVFLYYGDEIGMKNVVIPADMIQDPAAKGDLKNQEKLGRGRDPERTPMQWSEDRNSGFTSAAQPWLPLAPDYAAHNVRTEQMNPNSLLCLYQTLGKLRAGSGTLRLSGIRVLDVDSPTILGYIRERAAGDGTTSDDKAKYLILVNFSDKPATCLPGLPPDGRFGRLLVSTHPGSSEQPPSEHAIGGSTGRIKLRPHEAVVYEVA